MDLVLLTILSAMRTCTECSEVTTTIAHPLLNLDIKLWR